MLPPRQNFPASDTALTSPEGEGPDPFYGRITISDLIIFVSALAFFLLQLGHHQLWRDELNGWGLAVSSPDLTSLARNVHVGEGHTIFWYLLLWVPSRFTNNPIVLKLLEALVGSAIYFFLTFRSPFSRSEKVLILLGYFIVFEYTILSRVYGLCLLMTLVYLFFRSKYPDRVLVNGFLLGTLAFADSLGVILSVSLAAEYGWTIWIQSRTKQVKWLSVLLATLIYVLILIVSIWTALPSPEVSLVASPKFGTYFLDPSHLAVAINNAIVSPWLPIQNGFVTHYWGTIESQLQLFVLIPFILTAYYLIFRTQTSLLILMGTVLLGSIAFNHLVYEGRIRHVGVAFVAFLAGIWLLRLRTPAIPAIAKAMLALSATSGLAMSALLWTHPFSNAARTAQWIKDHHLQNAALVGTRDYTMASLAVELHRPVYFLDCDCSNTYMSFSIKRDKFKWEQIPDRLVVAKRNLNASELIFIANDKLKKVILDDIARHNLQLTPLAQIAGAGVPEEDFYIFRVR